VSAIQLIVGLGNPGKEYEQTRHNAGFWFADELARQCPATFKSEKRFMGELARCQEGRLDYRLFKPMTYMNRSGLPVVSVMRFFDIPLEAVLVVHDELDLPPGVARLKRGGGAGGHNGLRDLISHLGTNAFFRLRLGIGHPGYRDQVTDYVLGRASRPDRQSIDASIQAAVAVMPEVLSGDMERAMHSLHSA
jgi:PTH1 family peptidyl-tRNA hydrolase